MDGCRETDRGAVVVVGCDSDVVGLRHRGNLADFENAAAGADVGIDDVGRSQLEGGLEFLLEVELFACDDGNVDLASSFGEPVEIINPAS